MKDEHKEPATGSNSEAPAESGFSATGASARPDETAADTPEGADPSANQPAQAAATKTAAPEHTAAAAAPAAAAADAAPAAPASGGDENNTDRSASAAAGAPAATAPATSSGAGGYLVAAVAIVAVVAAVWFALERTGQVPTSIFGASAGTPSAVATVNGEPIPYDEFQAAVDQNTQAMTQQGADPSNPNLQAQVEGQAIDTLINTEVLRQEAVAQGFSVSDEDVDARISEIQEQVGGPEELTSRMEEVGIEMTTLRADIQDELLIQSLLDESLSLDEITVADEEIQAFYDQAGGEEAGLPPFSEVAEQIETQLRSQQEQEAVQSYLEELRGDASVDIIYEVPEPEPVPQPGAGPGTPAASENMPAAEEAPASAPEEAEAEAPAPAAVGE